MYDHLIANNKFVANRITELRIAKNVSARDMSLSIGLSEGHINKIENYKSKPSMQTFFYICEYFNISPLEFFNTAETGMVILKDEEKKLLNKWSKLSDARKEAILNLMNFL